MQFSLLALAASLLLLSPSHSTDGFTPRPTFASKPLLSSRHLAISTSNVVTVSSKPIEGMKPGTSGLRKKVEIWQALDESNRHYLENFIQSLIDTAFEANAGQPLDTVVVAGDGRYYNAEAIQIICRILAANGVHDIWVPQGGIMSTPAVSAVIRRKDGGKSQGGIVLTASHNPGGPGEDFGIKYNEGFGQPASEGFTDTVSNYSFFFVVKKANFSNQILLALPEKSRNKIVSNVGRLGRHRFVCTCRIFIPSYRNIESDHN
jgi:phosphoglucomutase